MQYKSASKIVSFVIIFAISHSVNAGASYSVSSLGLLCRNNNPRENGACIVYLHGVVETWMIKDVVNQSKDSERFNYLSNNNSPTYCETINKVSENEWMEIVRNNLNTMEPGFASNAVMKALSDKLCK